MGVQKVMIKNLETTERNQITFTERERVSGTGTGQLLGWLLWNYIYMCVYVYLCTCWLYDVTEPASNYMDMSMK